MLMKILGMFLTKKQLRYIERNPHKVEMEFKSYIPGLAILCTLIILSLFIYGMYTFIILMNLFITIMVFRSIFNSVFNSEDAKEQPWAYDHKAGIGFACTYGVVFLIIFLCVLIGSISFVHNIVFNS